MRQWIIPVLLCAALPLLAQGPPAAPRTARAMVQLFGSVTDSLTGKPVYDCLVEYYDAGAVRKAVCSVNADGRYSLFIPAGLSCELRITKENGYRELRAAVPSIPPGTATFRKDLLLAPAP